MNGTAISKGYADVGQGQVHYRSCGEGELSLLCLHPAPFSGLAFATIMPMLAQDHRTIAPDYPAHGRSDPMDRPPTIADYAEMMLAAFPGKHDVLGFHTGCLVAAEMALLAPDRIGHLVMLDPPAFEQDMRADLLQSNGVPPKFDEELATLAPLWERAVTRRAAHQTLAERIALFAEMMRGGERMNEGFSAGFSYPLENRLPLLTHQTTVIATGGPLAEAAKRAADLMTHAKFVDRSDIRGSALDANARLSAGAVLGALGNEAK
ncbi:MAG: alpha/beta hydrolase [Erythrobacter sp.]